VLNATRHETDEILDDLLSRWHHWQLGAVVARGFSSHSMVVGEFKSSRQYDDANGALWDDEETEIMKAVQAQVEELAPQYRAAIYAQARGLHSGFMVWSSPRLPSDPVERDQIIRAARAALVVRLVNAGVM
jgi:hypothetical protein